jgi:hypothetical protein
MRDASSILTALTVLTAAGCASLDDIRNVPIETGTQAIIAANVDVVKQAARAALTKATCAIEEESRVNEEITRMVGLTGMNIATLAPTMGVWCRYIIKKVDENKTMVFLYTKIRDPNDVFAKNSIVSVTGNIDTYFRAYIEEFSDQPSAPAPVPKHP